MAIDSDNVLTQLRAATQHALGLAYNAGVVEPERARLFDEALTELAELFDNFDVHLTQGGALPKDWQR